MNAYPVIVTSASTAVGLASAQFTPTMAAGQTWLFVSSTACWIAQGVNPTASTSGGNMYVPAGVQVLIDGSIAAKLAVIRDTADGRASLTRIKA